MRTRWFAEGRGSALRAVSASVGRAFSVEIPPDVPVAPPLEVSR